MIKYLVVKTMNICFDDIEDTKKFMLNCQIFFWPSVILAIFVKAIKIFCIEIAAITLIVDVLLAILYYRQNK